MRLCIEEENLGAAIRVRAREVSVRQGGESADKLKRYEAERDEVKTRIARLVKTLEETEAATKTA